MYDRAWLGGPERSLEIILTNIGRPLTGLSGFLLLIDLSSAQAEWAKGHYPGGSNVIGILVRSATQVFEGARQKDIEPGENVPFSFAARSILAGGNQFTVVLEYWDLEGRAYRAAWEFMTQGQDLKELWVDLRNQMPPQRVQHKDRS
jgi:rhodanese-related sulfurtransferase